MNCIPCNQGKMKDPLCCRRVLILTDVVNAREKNLPFDAVGEITLLSCFQIPENLVPVKKKAEAAQVV